MNLSVVDLRIAHPVTKSDSLRPLFSRPVVMKSTAAEYITGLCPVMQQALNLAIQIRLLGAFVPKTPSPAVLFAEHKKFI